MGNASLPRVPVWRNLKTNYGARGDGVTDDTAELLQAIRDFPGTSPGALYLPPGRYVISSYVNINKNNLVLRGAGPGQTTLLFTKPIGEVGGPCASRASTGSQFGGLICVGKSRSQRGIGAKLATITGTAQRGDSVLTVSSSANIRPGQKVMLVMYESADRSLGRHIHADQMNAGTYFAPGARMVEFVSPVRSVAGHKIVLERPLRLDVRPAWRPALHAFSPAVREVGIEELAIEFPSNPYRFHAEPGYNGVEFLPAVTDSWMRNVTLFDTDNGHKLGGRFCTAVGLRFSAKWRKSKYTAHHFVDSIGADNLIRNFALTTRAAHDLTVSNLANGNVFSQGTGVDINFDHHRLAPYENLFSDINVGIGSRLFESAGQPGAVQGPPSGARETFWNVRNSNGVPPAGGPAWPQINLIGNTRSSMTETKEWYEDIDPDGLNPQELYIDQLLYR
jgi:hypothetical protein